MRAHPPVVVVHGDARRPVALRGSGRLPRPGGARCTRTTNAERGSTGPRGGCNGRHSTARLARSLTCFLPY